MFLNLQHPHIRYIAPPAEGGSDTTDPTPPAEPNGNGEEIDWEPNTRKRSATRATGKRRPRPTRPPPTSWKSSRNPK